jgi:DNA repair protein RadA/Sms
VRGLKKNEQGAALLWVICALVILTVLLSGFMSIASSYFNTAISGSTLFYGDVSLTGEIKKCPNFESFAAEADRLGYKTLYVAKGCKVNKTLKNLKVVECDTINELITKLFK